MAYTTPDAVRLALAPGQADGSPSRSGTNTAADESDGVLDRVIAKTDARIDRYLRARYTVPFIDPPGDVGDIATDLAAYEATLAYRRGQPIQVNDPAQLRYNAAMKSLDDLAAGRATLDIPAPTAPQSSGEGVVVNGPYVGLALDVGWPTQVSGGYGGYRG